ncbi:tetratricopeptide repeat protein [Polaribacter pectinis]|uniref:histidine kinase n=1 Tax=Polaribacter pectinis TaxID=2738844 RepID=A0A7G9L7S3_9FLAO|nr:sensor histidine kinase [Polaribacter pectinis]QNM84672.1 tetratricopeptide repeat protein [Polaribacter pectinis]
MLFSKTKLICFVATLFCLNFYSQSAGKKIIDSLLIVSKKQTDKQKVLTYIEVAEKYTGIDLDSAKFYSDKAYNISLKVEDKRLKTIAIIQLGNFARENSEYTKAINYFKESLALSKSINDTVLIANSYSGLGIVNSRLGNFKEAISNFLKGIPVYEALKDTANIARGYLNLAVDLRKIKEFDRCILYNNKALTLFEKNNEHLNIAAIHNNLGGVYNENKEYLKAIKSAEKAKKYFTENDYERYAAYPLTNIAISYDSLNEPIKAEKNYLAAIKLHTEFREPYELAFLNNAYANFKYKHQDHKQAIKIGKKALDFAEEVKALEFITSSCKTLAKSFQKDGNYQQANIYLNKYIISKDSLFEKEKSKDIAEIQTKYETTKKEAQIAIQKEKLLENELAIKNRTLYAILLASALLILGIIFFAIYKKNQYKRKQLQKEIDLKDALATIKTQNRLQEQRLRISRDLHDNIGSQLTFIISSIDNLKYISKDVNDTLKDKLIGISTFTSETIHELRDTIWAMNKSEISVEDLHARILSFVEKAKIATENMLFEVNYNIDKNATFSSLEGMNIFRVIQEAINNAIKYAEASKVEIKLDKKDNQFIASVIDDGVGFDIKNVDLGNGLSNMEKRMSKINGKVVIVSEIEKGTTIKIYL